MDLILGIALSGSGGLVFGAATVGNTKKIELTITGGATAAEQVCEVFMACRKPLF
jgi:hypothetical protein